MAHLVSQVHKVLQDQVASQDQEDHVAPQGDLASKEQLGLLDPVVQMEVLVGMDSQDHREQQAQMEVLVSLVQLVQLVQVVVLEVLDSLDHKVKLDHEDSLVLLDLLVDQAPQDYLDL